MEITKKKVKEKKGKGGEQSINVPLDGAGAKRWSVDLLRIILSHRQAQLHLDGRPEPHGTLQNDEDTSENFISDGAIFCPLAMYFMSKAEHVSLDEQQVLLFPSTAKDLLSRRCDCEGFDGAREPACI